MANRLTKIYTRTGDAGSTGMADGSRISKDDALMHAQGDVDELNSLLGLLASQLSDEFFKEVIFTIQNNLFDLGAEVSLSQVDSRADSSHVRIEKENIRWLENKLDGLNQDLPPLKEFILPGGNEQAALCHLARSVCRRAERNLVSLGKDKKISPDLLAYINRLSDFLFVLARSVARQNGDTEIYWKPGRLTDDEAL